MSSGFRAGPSGSVRASIQKTIQNIKEIAGNHSDDDIYAMLKECNMDPNETAQKLLLQDTFHEVRRKRDKKKEMQLAFGPSQVTHAFAGTFHPAPTMAVYSSHRPLDLPYKLLGHNQCLYQQPQRAQLNWASNY